MAKITNNLVIHGISGMLGRQVVVRRMRNGQYTLSAAPKRSSKEQTVAQKEHRERFRLATQFAKTAQSTPEYKELAESRGLSAYNVAIADFLHRSAAAPPQ